MELFEAILGRRTIKDFTADAVPRAVLERALEAGIWAQNHRLTEPWRFTILGPETHRGLGEIYAHAQASKAEGETREKLRADAAGKIASKPQIVATSCVLAADESQREEDHAAVACAIQNIQLAAWALGLGMQWSTGKVIRLAETYRLLGIDPEKERIVGLLYFGFPAKVPPAPRRKALPEVSRWLE